MRQEKTDAERHDDAAAAEMYGLLQSGGRVDPQRRDKIRDAFRQRFPAMCYRGGNATKPLIGEQKRS